MAQYLYGAKVQGIQSYIFETNKLKDIGGASELIESLAGERFAVFFDSVGVEYDKEQLLRNAAGEISYLFTDKASCEAVVLNFEKYIATEIPGLTVSQAVVEVDGEHPDLAKLSGEVNRKLQIQRSRQGPPNELGWMISERARKTGRPAVAFDKKDKHERLDRRQSSKRDVNTRRLYDKLLGEKHGLKDKDYSDDLTHISGNRERKWLAVVHADGNNLGKLIQTFLPKLAESGKAKAGYREFSVTLEEATKAAARVAYREVLKPVYDEELNQYKAGEKKNAPRLPIRPVIIGGDDLTVILRAEHAVDFTRAYLAAFERETKTRFKDYGKKYSLGEFENGLTACAGIAIIKPKYPFHYAADLAEELCSWTKKIAKKIDDDHTPSCLHFHKVQASFVEDYKNIVVGELRTQEGRLLTAGPYFVSPGIKDYLSIQKLLDQTDILKQGDTPTGPLRDYVGELKVDEAAAKQKLSRIRELNKKVVGKLGLDEHSDGFLKRSNDEQPSTHLYDALQLHSL